MRLGMLAGLGALFALGCGDVCTREGLSVKDQATFDAVARCTEFPGDLVIESVPGLVRAELPSLRHVGILTFANNPELTEVSLPALETVALDGQAKVFQFVGLTVRGNKLLKTVSAPKLSSIGNEVERAAKQTGLILDAPLSTFDAPKLTSVTGMVYLSGTELTTFSLPGLVKGNEVQIERNSKLTALELGELVDAQVIVVSDNATLATVKLPKLTQVAPGNFEVQKNPALKTVALSAYPATRPVTLTGSAAELSFASGVTNFLAVSADHLTEVGSGATTLHTVLIRSNQTLTKLTFPNLTSVQSTTIESNGSLSSCEANELKTVSAQFSQTGNREDSSCP